MDVHYTRLECACGHAALVGTSRWLHRTEMLRRARCTVCGRRGAKDMTVHTLGWGMGKSRERQLAEVAAVPVFQV